MIKRILVALDPDSDTPVATRYAAEIAARYDAEVTGLAVIDLERIQADSRGGGIGSMYYAEKLQEQLTEDTRAKAVTLVQEFETAMDKTGVRYNDRVREGVPFRRIVEDMKYHDLLIVGDDPHFFYGRPEKPTSTLARIVKETIAPTLIVENTYERVERVLVAYDGSEAAARTLQRFVHLQPFGTDVDLEVLTIYEHDEKEADLLLKLVRDYLSAHGFSPKAACRKGGDPSKQIVHYAQEIGANLVLAGAHAKSKFKRIAFGSTTAALIDTCPVPLFLHH